MAKIRGWTKDKGRRNGASWTGSLGGWVYLYDKGWFRSYENYFVISTSKSGGSNPTDRKNTKFKTKDQALKFAISWMRRHPYG